MDFGREKEVFPLVLIQVKSAAKRTVFDLKNKREKTFLPFKTQLFHIQVVRYAASETITGLVAGTKKVVVVANVPSAITFPDSINYGWFEDAGNVIDLDTQATTADGLFMSGEDTVVLSANTVSEATIPISRVVAKVKLGTLTIAPEAGHDAAKFALTKVMVMKARSSVKMGLPSVDYTPNAFYGGMQGDKSTVKTYLAETISTGDYANRYFFLFPA